MKKPIIILMFALLSLSSCGKEKDPSSFSTSEDFFSSEVSTLEQSSTQEVTSESSEEPSTSEEVIKDLKTPFARFNDETKVVSWDKVDEATHYNYIINDGEVQTTTSNTLALKDKSTVSIQAANSISKSKWSNAVTCYDTSDVIVNVKKDVKVYFHNSNISSLTIKEGEKVAKPTNPSKEHCTFDNWYKDPFYQEVFDFDAPIYENTIIYANYIENDLIKDVTYWVKCDSKMTSSIQSSASGWKYIPLKLSSTNPYREFSVNVNVSGASTTSPSAFLVVDGLDDNPGRTYWKNGDSDFAIASNGTYTITFSVETEYKMGSMISNVKYQYAVNSASAKNVSDKEDFKLDTPIVTVDESSNMANWNNVTGANKYEVIINNQEIQEIIVNYIELSKNSHITVRAISEDNYSSWSIPKANINTIYEESKDEKTHVFAYFLESNENARKVAVGSSVENGPTLNKEGYTFDGWYLDIACTKKVTFPYVMNENTVFYPKWTYIGNYSTDACYKLVYANGTKIADLKLNADNFDFYEYKTGPMTLTENKSLYVKTLDDSKSWGPYTVKSTGSYKLYFSEEHLWAIETDKERNIYIASLTTTIYFSNNKGWSDVYAYVWNKSTDTPQVSWPGTKMSYVTTNEYGESIYSVSVDTYSYDYIIFNNGSGSQTVDIKIGDDNGYYCTEKNSEGKYGYGNYTYSA